MVIHPAIDPAERGPPSRTVVEAAASGRPDSMVNKGDMMRAVPRTARDAGRLVALVLPVLALLVTMVVGGAGPARAADDGSTPTGSAVSISLIPATSSALRPARVSGGPAAKTTESVRISLIPATSSAIVPTAKSAGEARPAGATEPARSTEPAQSTAAVRITGPAPTAAPAQPPADPGSAAGTDGVQRSAPESLGARTASPADPAVEPADPMSSPSAPISLIPATSSAIAAPTAVAGAGTAILSSQSAAEGGVANSVSPSSPSGQDLQVSLAMAEAAVGKAPDLAPATPLGVADGGGSGAWLLGAAVLVATGGVGIALARLHARRRTSARPHSH